MYSLSKGLLTVNLCHGSRQEKPKPSLAEGVTCSSEGPDSPKGRIQLKQTACYCCREVLVHGSSKLAAMMLWKTFFHTTHCLFFEICLPKLYYAAHETLLQSFCQFTYKCAFIITILLTTSDVQLVLSYLNLNN